MNFKFRVLFACLICLIVASAAVAQKRRNHPAVSISGVYGGDFTVGKGSGDLEGERIVIFNAGNAYHAIVQLAEGGAEDPQPQYADVTVKGMSVAISVGERKFSGTISAAGLRLRESGGPAELLRRKPCSSFL
jgi:hypothetical protein